MAEVVKRHSLRQLLCLVPALCSLGHCPNPLNPILASTSNIFSLHPLSIATPTGSRRRRQYRSQTRPPIRPQNPSKAHLPVVPAPCRQGFEASVASRAQSPPILQRPVPPPELHTLPFFIRPRC
ncbi:uncharacterized protein DS421_10g306940 [Arachis hypogaea]|nr:uncharacterized protein DS421_10g306940 [Arachis hypogaea]